MNAPFQFFTSCYISLFNVCEFHKRENADFRVFNKISENVEKDSYIRNNMESVEAPITEILGKINIRWVIIQSYESPTWSYMPL